MEWSSPKHPLFLLVHGRLPPPVINSVTPCARARARPFRFRTRLAWCVRVWRLHHRPSFSSCTDSASDPIPSL